MFERMCKVLCTEEEICNIFRIDKNTLNKRLTEQYGGSFSQVYKRFSDEGRMSLRRLQMRLAEKSAAMAIFLGKNILGQVDTPLIDQSQHSHYVVKWNENTGTDNRLLSTPEPKDRTQRLKQV